MLCYVLQKDKKAAPRKNSILAKAWDLKMDFKTCVLY